MKFLIFALCIGVAFAELPLEEVVVETHEEQVHHEQEVLDLCKEQGVFANPHDPEHRTFIRCELEPIELQCDEGFVFNEEVLMCVEVPKPEPVIVNLDLVNWREILTCDPAVEDKYFRNPYDCSKFYRCYTQGEFKRMDPMTCLSTMVFDEVLETCLPAEQFNSLYGVGCQNAPLPEVKKPEEVPETHEEVPEVPEVPETHEEVPEVPEVPETHEEIPEVPEVPETHEEIPEVPEVPETHEEIPEVPETHEEIPEVPEVPETHEEIPEVPETHEEIPEVPETHEEIPEVPETHEEIPEEHHEIPEETHEIPEETHEIPEVPEVPETHEEIPEETHEEVPQEAEKPKLEDILKQIKGLFGNM